MRQLDNGKRRGKEGVMRNLKKKHRKAEERKELEVTGEKVE